MKKEQWQAVYTPSNEEMLERRVRQTLSGLQEDAPARRISGRRMMLIAAALLLMLAAAVAAAAGWMRSAKYDAKRLAQEALYEKYGFTREMDSFFICTVEENDGGLTSEMLDGEQSEIYAVCTLEEGQVVWSVWHHSELGISIVKISAEDGTIMDVIVDSGMAGNG